MECKGITKNRTVAKKVFWRGSFYRVSAAIFTFFLLLSLSCLSVKAEIAGQPDTILVWSADYGLGERVFFSSYEVNNWTAPVQVNDNGEPAFLPSAAFGGDGSIWVVWSEQNNNGSFLHYSVYSNSKWTEPATIDTGMNNNKAVTVIVDRDDRLWLAWTGIEDTYSDIFWSRWNGTGCDVPAKAHADNSVPDVEPSFSLDDSGRVVLSWQTFYQGSYVTESRVWDGGRWQNLPRSAQKNTLQAAVQQRADIPPVPEFVEDAIAATLFIQEDVGVSSIPLSLQ